MNLSAAVMLINKSVRPVKVVYDPDNSWNNKGAMTMFFKCLDPEVQKDDLVVVETTTRHGFTIAKVTEVDFAVDFESTAPWGWIAQKFDVAAFDKIKAADEAVRIRVAKAQENKMRKELMEAAGLGEVDFTDLQLMSASTRQVPAGAIEQKPAAADGQFVEHQD